MNVLNHTQFNGAYVGGLGGTNLTNNPAQRTVPRHRERRQLRHPRPGDLQPAPDAVPRHVPVLGGIVWQEISMRRMHAWIAAGAGLALVIGLGGPAGGPGRGEAGRQEDHLPRRAQGPRRAGPARAREGPADAGGGAEAAPNLKGVKTEVYVGKAPTDLAVYADAAAIVIESSSDRDARETHPLFPPEPETTQPHLRPGDARLPQGHRRAGQGRHGRRRVALCELGRALGGAPLLPRLDRRPVGAGRVAQPGRPVDDDAEVRRTTRSCAA